MSEVTVTSGDTETVVQLKDPAIAAVLAWLIPGAGHLYQGRTGKGLLFMVCILGTFFYGLILGGGKVVYAARKPIDRLPFVCQLGVGLPALPAIVEAYRASKHQQRVVAAQELARVNPDARNAEAEVPPFRPWFGGMMVPPKEAAENDGVDELAQWHRTLHRNFELGTVFTMIAGLLNILVIYDAWGGPMQYPQDEKRQPLNPAPLPKPA